MNPERFRTYVFLGLLVLALALCVALLLPFLRVLGWAVVLSVIAYPVHRLLSRLIQERSVVAALSCLIVVVAVVVPVSFLALEVAEDTAAIALDLQTAARERKLPRWLDASRIPMLRSALGWLDDRVDLSALNMESLVQQTLGKVSAAVTNSMGFVKDAAWFGMQLALTLVTLFFLLRDGPRLLPAVHDFIPLNDGETRAVLKRAEDTLHATVYGATAVATTQGALGGLVFWALGLPSPLFWGAVMTALCFVPLLGAPVVWVPAALWLAVMGLYWKALALVLAGVLLIGLVDNVLRPIVIGARAELHTLVVFFSVLGGLFLMGPLGLLLGPVILSVTLALLEILKFKLKEGEEQRRAAGRRSEIAGPAIDAGIGGERSGGVADTDAEASEPAAE